MASLLDLAQARLGGLLAPPQRPSMVGLLGGQRPQGTLASTIAGYTPPQMQAMSNQQVMDYARTVAQTAQQNMAQQMSDLDKALVMGQGGIQVGDREALARLMEQVPGLMGATAYHGTPHTIRGKFDISKVGTGEGAQAYGHGMYFAENPSVAEAYSKIMPTGGQQPSPIRTIFGKEVEPMTPEYKAAQLVDEMGLSKAKKFVSDWAKDPAPDQVEFVKNVQNSLLGITKKSDVKNLGTGNLYKVDIPDEYIPNMLDWDKPLSQQTPEVQAALKKHENFNTQKVLDARLKTRENLVKEGKSTEIIDNQIAILKEEIENPTLPDMTGEKYYTMYRNRFNDIKQTSDYLGSLGIKGIRYLDEGSRDAGKGTSNFVVFDPTDVKILEKNSQKVEGLLD